jgi:hypothetical protein
MRGNPRNNMKRHETGNMETTNNKTKTNPQQKENPKPRVKIGYKLQKNKS